MDKKTLALSALVGFIVGVFWMSDWQWSLEAAEVVAGTISLPTANPMVIFAKHLYAPFLIWPQVALLKLGVSSENISILFSGIQSGLSFMSVTAFLLVISKDRIVSLVTPIILTYLPDTLFIGHSYSVFFPTNLNNGGLLAFSAVIMAIASLGAGYMQLFLLILGILPALHPGMAMGVWFGAIVYYVVSDKTNRLQMRNNVRWFVYGVVFFFITVLIHRLLSGSFIEQATVVEKRIVDYFISFVDGHRSPKLSPLSWKDRLGYFEPEIMLFVGLPLLFGRYKQFMSKGTQNMLKLLGAMSVSGVVMTLLWEMYSNSFPSILKTVMFARWLNFDSILLPLFFIGAICMRHSWRKISALSILFFFGMYGSIVWWWMFAFLIVCFEIEMHAPNVVKAIYDRASITVFQVVALCFCLFIIGKFIQGGTMPLMRYSPKKIALLSKISQGEGLFISSHQILALPQVMTHRGLAFNLYWMDTMTYVPTVAGEMEDILNNVYGFSIFDKGIWPSLDVIRLQWEKRSLAQWQDIKARYDVTDVLSPNSWNLKLPKVIESETLVLYHIP